MIKQIVDKGVVEGLYKEGLKHSAYGMYERKVHGYKVFKIPLNARFVCPNWDGRLSDSGCIFCPSHAKQFTYQSFREVIDKGFTEQIRHQVEHYQTMGAGEKGLVYIAFGTNTYAPLDRLRQIFDETVKAHKDIIGFTIGTRPDCLPDEVLDLLAGYKRSGYEVWVEAGQQTVHDFREFCDCQCTIVICNPSICVPMIYRQAERWFVTVCCSLRNETLYRFV